MAMKPEFKSDAFAAIHAAAAALQKVGAIDMTTMRQFDASCLASPAALESAPINKPKVSRSGAHD